MPKEKPEAELERLRNEQEKTRGDEVFMGFSSPERAEYLRKSDRIYELQSEIQKAKQRLPEQKVRNGYSPS